MLASTALRRISPRKFGQVSRPKHERVSVQRDNSSFLLLGAGDQTSIASRTRYSLYTDPVPVPSATAVCIVADMILSPWGRPLDTGLPSCVVL